MPSWKKLIQSGSSAHLSDITASGTITATSIEGQTNANSAVLQQDLNVVLNNSVGTIDNGETLSAGTSIEALLRNMLIDFINPTMDSFTITGLNHQLEVGDTDIVTAGTFATSSNSSTNGFDSGVSLSLSNNDNSLGTVTISGETIDFPDLTIRATSAKQIKFTLTGTFTGGSGGTATKTDTCNVRHPYFFGTSEINATTENINSNIDSILADISGSGTATNDQEFNSNTGTYGTQTYLSTINTTSFNPMTLTLPDSAATTGQFFYIIYPSSYGNLSKIDLGGVEPILSTFTQLSSNGDNCNHTRFSVATEYNVYKSTLPGAFTIGDTVLIDD